ncbi:MAG TPA: hypothetical protein VHO06_03840 [Polyangia bacterium]|nr:hypothetical protein [Polyangia bacterium]
MTVRFGRKASILAAVTTVTMLLGGPRSRAADPTPPPGLDAESLGLEGRHGIAPPVPPTVDAASAALYCRSMELNARRYARRSSSWGWVFGVAAAGAIATGPIIIATETESPSRREKILSLTIPAAGAVLGYIANGLFTRAKDHGTLAAQASLALNQPSPADEVIACNAALAAWNTARSEASQPLMSVVNASKPAAQATTGATAPP